MTDDELAALLIEVRRGGTLVPPDRLPGLFVPLGLEGTAPHSRLRDLGLPIARLLVERMGGGVTVESDPSSGTVFTVWLPVAGQPLPTGAAGPILGVGTGGGRFILQRGSGTNMRITDVRKRLDDATSDHRLLTHPFYRAWVEGALTTDDLATYAEQYWRQVEAFPGYLEAIAARLPTGRPRRTLEENLADERDGNHGALWLRFAEAVGSSADRCRASSPETETTACVEAFGRAASSATLPFALGMIYGYESQTPEVAEAKVMGLRDRYGIQGEGVTYFSLHATLDVEHARELREAIAEVAPDDAELAEAEAGARAGAAAAWGLLSGVARVRGIC